MAFGHCALKAKINDTTPVTYTSDLVLSAAEAEAHFTRGNLRVTDFPSGQDPRAALASARLNRAAIKIQKHEEDTERLDMPLAKSIVAAVVAHTFHNFVDPDLGPDEIAELHNTARSFLNSGMDLDELKMTIATLIGTLRDIVRMDRHNPNFDEEIYDLVMQMTEDND
ncbi:MAG: hypothetical protein FD143_3454 [Ignavibacteria bacterium]|nr:MAG: hypothetical protein FD143_3454 [Ignavibacteria bacterium]